MSLRVEPNPPAQRVRGGAQHAMLASILFPTGLWRRQRPVSVLARAAAPLLLQIHSFEIHLQRDQRA